MKKYICPNCDNLVCDTSVCPVCHARTILIESSVFYCKHCKAPSYTEYCSKCNEKLPLVGTDIRPVFPQERLLLEVLEGEPFKYANSSMWCLDANHYLIDGVKVTLPFTEYRKQDPQVIIEKLKDYNEQNQQYVEGFFDSEPIKNFIEMNSIHLNEITDEAIDYIKDISKGFDLSSMFVSFSGGKDSTVTSHLVMRALGTESITHIYGDTTLEFPESLNYIERFKKEFPKTPVLVARNNDQDFNDLCNVVGPPSRVMRWCCTVFKTGAITKKIEQTFKSAKRILSFQGIRRNESRSRSKYERDTDSPKISKQIASSPLIDWSDFDVWLYILSNGIPFNGAYQLGFSRVGCWCCPNNSDWSAFLSSIYMNDQYNVFKGVLYDFAKKVGKEDWKDYVDSGKWKARQGGNGLDYSRNAVVVYKPCTYDDESVNFDLTKPLDENFYTFFKPFGEINYDLGNKRLGEVYILSKYTKQPILKITGKLGATTVKVTILSSSKPFSSKRDAIECIRNQITKFQACIGCTYCQSVCKYSALKVNNTEKGNVSNSTISYTIDSSKCVSCLECVKHFDGGCYMKKILRTRKGEYDEESVSSEI